MTAEELLEDLKTCTGPCGRMCLSCPESRYVAEIYRVVEDLVKERNMLEHTIELMKYNNGGKSE